MKKLLVCVTVLLAGSPASASLIINGDFEAGNTGFTTEYTIPSGTVVGGAGEYLTVFNPADHHPSGANYGDHTTGSGLMMMVNESMTPNRLVWGQTVSVVPGADYHFEAFISSWVAAAPSRLDVLFNGTSVGTMFAPGTTGVWVGFTADWNAGAATALTVELRNLTTADVGGDFALDDLSLEGPSAAAVPEPPTAIGLAFGCLGLVGWVWLRRHRGVRTQVA